MEDIAGPIFIERLWLYFFPQLHLPAALLSAWLVLGILLTVSLVATRGLRLVPDGMQNVLEMALEYLHGLCAKTGGPEAARFLPLFATLFLFILCSNLMGLIPGFLSPTANININAALALVVACSTEFLGFRHKGVAGYFKHLCGPPYWLAPLFIVIRGMEVFTRPLSLTVRLFGNMLAKELVLGVLVYMITLLFFSAGIASKLLMLVPLVLRPCIILLGVLVGFVQALVFTTLAMSYIGSASQPHE